MTDSVGRHQEGQYRVLCGTCPDTQCQTRLFFPAHNSSIECTGCGQRHERDAIKQVSPDPTALDPGPRSPSLSRHSPLYTSFPAHNSSIECTGCGQRHERDAIKQVCAPATPSGFLRLSGLPFHSSPLPLISLSQGL